MMIHFDNVGDGEIVHQIALLVKGHCSPYKHDMSYIRVKTTNQERKEGILATQTWPLHHGSFTFLVALVPGVNNVEVNIEDEIRTHEIRVDYVPQLEQPLQFAIMVAKDSDDVIDCPENKPGGASFHAPLPFVIAKMRMAAFMFQALMAEEMRDAGLGRRSFRLEEEWSRQTLSERFFSDCHTEMLYGSTIKIHVVESDATMEEIRRADNQTLCNMFLKALKDDDNLNFHSKARPFVAGLILDSHYNPAEDMPSGHTAFSHYNPNSRSVGVIGSQLVHSWPRCIEEVAECLLDHFEIKHSVCNTSWEACAKSQASLFEEIGHAFGIAQDRSFIQIGHRYDWAKCFVAPADKADENAGITAESQWSMEDKLRLYNERPFKQTLDREIDSRVPTVTVRVENGQRQLVLRCPAGINSVFFNGKLAKPECILWPTGAVSLSINTIEGMFSRENPLSLKMICMNGKHVEMPLWKVISSHAPIQVPDTSTFLVRKGIGHPLSDNDSSWVVMLKRRTAGGRLVRAYKIDIRVGERLQPPAIFYEDGTKISGGTFSSPRGSQSKKLVIPRASTISSVTISYRDPACLMGMRLGTSDRYFLGATNYGSSKHCSSLEPASDEVIVGFYGTTRPDGTCCEFGLLLAPKGLRLPDSLYRVDELRDHFNTVEAHRRRGGQGLNPPRPLELDMNVIRGGQGLNPPKQQEPNMNAMETSENAMETSETVMETSEDADQGYEWGSCTTCELSLD